MTPELRKCTLGELVDSGIAELQTGPFGTTLKASEYTEIGTPLISVGEIREGFLRVEEDTPRVSKETTQRLKKYLLLRGDIVFGRKGSTHRNAIIKDHEEGYFLGSDGIRLRITSDTLNPKFLSYQLRSTYSQTWLKINSEGTTMPSLNQDILSRFPLLLHPIESQRAIAHILGTLDDKIELNQRMNQTLEEIAKAIFKSWFVDFDPVRAKAEGRPTGLPPEISDLFPDELVDSEIGEIPKGWDIKPAESLFDITIGRTPPRKESQWFTELETDVPWVSIRDMGDCGTFISKTSEYLTNDAVSKHRMQKLPVGSVLVSFKLTVGRVAITTQNMTTNEAIAHFPPSDAFPYPNFAYFYLKGFGYESLGSTSSIATAVNSKMIKAIPFIVAASDLTEKFEEIVAPMMDRIRLASEETHVLSELRDTLLPKLISGELRIPDAEKFFEEAGI